jgi:tetratricopeptide (TPR) repeat protein
MGHLADSSTPETASSPVLGREPAGEGSPPGVRAGEVRAELEKVLAADTLRDSEMLKRFLRYVVEQTLAGQADHLKEYRLGVDVFDREETFDPRLDPVVRMAAGRLRKKLQEYYESDGRQDRMRIEVPKGGYAASFVSAPASQRAGDTGAAGRVERRGAGQVPAVSRVGNWALAAAAILVSAALVAAAFHYHARQTRRLTDKDTVVLADFANSTGDPVFDDALKTALVLSLRQSPFLNVLSEQKVAANLQAMTLPADTKLTPAVTQELCQRAGSKAYIAGAIGSLGSEYVLGLRAVNCQSGDTLAQEQVTTSSKEKILVALGAAASRLRSELGESLATVQKFDVPLVDATTSSLEALKAFSLGQKVYREKGPGASLPYNRKAIEIDPNFALGYFSTGSDYHSLNQVGRANEYLTKAFQLREHVSEREKLAIAAFYYRNVTGELDKAIQTDHEEIANYPREMYAYVRLGVDFAYAGQYEKARATTQEALRLTPDHVLPYDNLTAYTLALQRFDETERIVHEAQERKLDNIMLHTALYALAFFDADSAAMAEQEKWFSGAPEENYGLALASDTEAFTGHEAKARELTQRALDSAIRADSKETGAIWLENEALRESAYGYAAKSRQTSGAGLKFAPSSQGVEVEAALAFAMAGDTTQADSLAQDLKRRFSLDTQMQSLWLPAIRAQLALNRKKPALALTALQSTSAIELGLVPFVNNISCLYPTYVRGEAYLAAGQGGAAAAEFQKILDHSGIVWNCWTGALAHLGVARANALQARTSQGADADAARVRALAAYRDFLTLWKGADPDIPILKQAKAAYAKLQ